MPLRWQDAGRDRAPLVRTRQGGEGVDREAEERIQQRQAGEDDRDDPGDPATVLRAAMMPRMSATTAHTGVATISTAATRKSQPKLSPGAGKTAG